MAKFDFVDAAVAGYAFSWKNRREIIWLAALPLLVKLGSYAAIVLLGLENNLLRQGLVLLPAHLVEGFLVIQVIRMAMFGERPVGGFSPPSRPDEARRRAIMGGTVVYLLTKLVSSLLAGWAMIAENVEDSPTMPEPNGSVFVTAVMILVFLIWAYRFFWLYVPVAMDIPVGEFLLRIKPFMSSVYMLGLSILCFVPIATMLIVLAKILAILFAVKEGSQSLPYIVFLAGAQAAAELAIVVISSVGMAYAFKSLLKGGSGLSGKH